MTRPAITADFAGNACPVGSRVRFTGAGRQLSGVVAELRRARAVVMVEGCARWLVPYAGLAVVDRVAERECTLAEVEALARRLIARHQAAGHLDPEWTFGFDLAPARAGVCRYRPKRIDLSVSYCHRAARVEIEDTVLHEIAHAMVGPTHRHDAVWQDAARRIGCTAARCHDVDHTVTRWVGACGCGQRWFRQRLARAVRRATCRRCGAVIAWRLNTDGALRGT